jgi:hypothetical protein
MVIRNHAAIAAATVVVALLAVQYLVLPVHAWTALVVTSVLAVALSAGALIYLPAASTASDGGDAGRSAETGPIAMTAGVTFLLSVIALGTTFLHFGWLSWTLLVLAIACFVVGLVTSHATRDVADDEPVSQAKDDRYRDWSSALEEIAGSVADSTLRSQLYALAGELRHAPSARAHDATNEAMLVTNAIATLRQSAQQGDRRDIAARLGNLEILLSQHSSALIALRSHA